MTSMLAKCSLPMLSLLLGISLGLPPAARAGSPLSNDPSPLAVCQDSIRTAGLRLATDARRVLSACFTAGIECVAGETGTRADCCEDAARRCRGRLPKLERAIRRFATFVENRRCRVVPFADIVAPDGLGYGALADACGGIEPRRAADDLTGLVECLAAVVVEDTACALGLRELPRSAEALVCMAMDEPDLSSCAAPSAATPTPTPAVSATPTAAPTTVPTSTPIVTAVGTETPPPSATPIPTATAVGTPSATATATGTSLVTATPIRTVTPTSGPTVSPIVTATTVPTAAATTTPVATATTVPTAAATTTPIVAPTATTTPVRTVTPVPTVTIVPTVTAAPTTTATLTAVSTATATRTPTPVATSTPTGPVCGNGVIESGEACDDGNTVGCDDCPKNCQANTAPAACSATTVRHAQRVRLQAPAGAVLSGGQICLDYPTGVVALPGTGNVAGRSSNLAGLVTLNDYNNAVQLTFVANPGTAQVNPTISFDLCTGQTAPIPSAFGCVVKGASNQGTAIDPSLVQCTPITIP